MNYEQILDEIHQEWAKDCKFRGIEFLAEDDLMIPDLHQKYSTIRSRYRILLEKKKFQYVKLQAVKKDYYSGSLTEAELKKYGWEQYQKIAKTTTAIDRCLSVDEDLAAMREEMAVIEEIMDYCRSVELEVTKNRTYQVKNALDALRQNGVIP